MMSCFSPGDLLSAVLTLRLGYLSPGDMARLLIATRDKAEQGETPLETALVERGVLTPPRLSMIQTLREQHRVRCQGDFLQCLNALGLDAEAQQTLAGGDEAAIHSLMSRFAPSGGASTDLGAPGGKASPEIDGGAATEYPATAPLSSHGSGSDGGSSGAESSASAAGGSMRPQTLESALRFRKLRRHAKGGLGKISIAEDEQFHRRVALKEILEKYADSPDDRARFIREAEITGALEHPGIVPVYAVGQFPDGRPFYAMRLIHGASLQAAIHRFHRNTRRHALASTLPADPRRHSGKSQPGDFTTSTATSSGDAEPASAKAVPAKRAMRSGELRRLLRRFIDVCDTIQYAHSRGVIHRDLKPSNIMLGKYGETFVVDWGLAKTLPEADFQVEDASSGFRPLPPADDNSPPTLDHGRVVGTPGFMAPEQAAADAARVGAAADIYSLGATLYYLLTGRASIQASSVNESIQRVVAGDYPRPREVNPAVPPPLEAICLKAMAAAPGGRYPTAAALAEDLEHWLADEPVAAWRETWLHGLGRQMRRHRNWTLAAGAALVMIALVSTAAAFWISAARHSEVKARQDEVRQRRLAEKRTHELEEQKLRAEKQKQLAEDERGRAERERRKAEHLAASLLVKDVESLVRDRPLGWTWRGLKQLTQATKLAPSHLDQEQVRTLAVACLTSIDARLVGEFAVNPTAHCVAFSPDSLVLAIAQSKADFVSSGKVALVSRKDGQERTLTYSRDWKWELKEKLLDGGRSLAFSPDGRWLVAGTRSGWIHRWDLHDLEIPAVAWKARPEDVEVHELRFSPDGESLYAVSRNGRGLGAARTVCSITRWRVADWSCQPAAVQTLRGIVHLAWSPEPNVLFATGAEASWLDAQSLEVIRTRPAEDVIGAPYLIGAAGGAAADFLVSEHGGTPRLLHGASGALVASLLDSRSETGHAGAIRNLDLSFTGRLLASGANEDGVKIWDLSNASLALFIPLPGSATTSPAFSPDGRYLASPAVHVTRLYEVRGGEAQTALALQTGVVEGFAFSHDGNQLFSIAAEASGSPPALSAWKADGTQKLWTIQAPEASDAPRDLVLHPSGHAGCFLAGSTLYWLDLRTQPPTVTPLSAAGSPRAVVFSHDGARLWTVEGADRIRAWQAPSEGAPHDLTLLREYDTASVGFITGRRSIRCLAGAGQRVLVGLDSEFVMVLDGDAEDASDIWRIDAEEVATLAVSGDHRFAAVGGNNGRVTVFEAATGKRLADIPAFTEAGVASLTLRPNGSMLAAASDNGQVRLWRYDGEVYEPLAALREADGRKVVLRFHPLRPWLTAQVEGERSLRLWRLASLRDQVGLIGVRW